MKFPVLTLSLLAFVAATFVQSAPALSNFLRERMENAVSETARTSQSEVDDLTEMLANLRPIRTGREKIAEASRMAAIQRMQDPPIVISDSRKRGRFAETPSASSSYKKFQRQE